jgi:hypothetical protein
VDSCFAYPDLAIMLGYSAALEESFMLSNVMPVLFGGKQNQKHGLKDFRSMALVGAVL